MFLKISKNEEPWSINNHYIDDFLTAFYAEGGFLRILSLTMRALRLIHTYTR
jgi:hypothetical protein